MSDDIPREVLTWESFGQASRDMARGIVRDGYRPDLILGIARGGLLPAGSISYAMDMKNVHVINVEFYTGVNERLEMPVMLPPVPQVVDLAAKRVLIVDDVADTGGTLQVVRDFCAEHVAETRCAVIYEKDRSTVQCEYVWKRTNDWIDFPWSSQAPVA